ncbi:MAG: dihydrolipoamide succinyltransferase [Paracoccus denitrificans]|nr:MAG: dihydrolipoamide succinyltransferase [Paracoccus denitrificans]PZO84301.1 MAG: dihydrolipoamide succinyltransferase [Paracoccus denitrificans]
MVDVLVPLEQEGTEAVVSSWLCAVGDRVRVNDPLVELETDKVSVEVPAPAEGILAEILIESGKQALPGAVLARITLTASEGAAPDQPTDAPGLDAHATDPAGKPSDGPDMSHWHSPAVRRALAETGVDPATISGTGKDGRLTRADVEKAASQKPAGEQPAVAPAPPAVPTSPPAAPTPAPPPATASSAPSAPVGDNRPAQMPAGGSVGGGGSRMVPHDSMRLAIARNMVKSVTDAPQVTAVFEADFSAIQTHRTKTKKAFEARGISLSYTSYIVLAAARAMAAVPQINSRWHDSALEIFDDINIGVGTALGDKGLVVPVIRRVQDLSLEGVAIRLQDMTSRARAGAIKPEDTRGGTFTISNHGVSGSLFAAPIIINQPQSAILGIGKLEKRVVVKEIDGNDAILVRPMAYVSLTIDHRSLDGHQTNTWLTAFVQALESWT